MCSCVSSKSASKSRFSPPRHPGGIAAIALLFLVRYYFAHHTPSRPVALLLASLPPLFMLLLYALIVQFLNADRDEVQVAYRRHATTWATGGTLACVGCGAGWRSTRWCPTRRSQWRCWIFIVFLAIALLALRRRYQ